MPDEHSCLSCDETRDALRHVDDKVDQIGQTLARIDERTQRMDTEVDRRFASAHARIDEVRQDASRSGGKTGAAVGAAAGGFVSALLRVLGFPPG